MDSMVLLMSAPRSKHWSWWIGDGRWWLMVEGFGLVQIAATKELK